MTCSRICWRAMDLLLKKLGQYRSTQLFLVISFSSFGKRGVLGYPDRDRGIVWHSAEEDHVQIRINTPRNRMSATLNRSFLVQQNQRVICRLSSCKSSMVTSTAVRDRCSGACGKRAPTPARSQARARACGGRDGARGRVCAAAKAPADRQTRISAETNNHHLHTPLTLPLRPRLCPPPSHAPFAALYTRLRL